MGFLLKSTVKSGIQFQLKTGANKNQNEVRILMTRSQSLRSAFRNYCLQIDNQPQ
jgi:hypothetical protein